MPNLYLILAVAVISSSSTWWVQSQHYGKIIAENDNKAWNLHLEALNNKIALDRAESKTEYVEAELVEVRNEKQKVITREIEKEVIRYAKKPDDTKCILNADWVHIHDAAANGTLDLSSTENSTGKLDEASTANVHDK